jgi:hypothetical protein
MAPIRPAAAASTQPVPGPAVTASTACPAVVVPAYFYNSALWQSVTTANQNTWVIMNPSNGAGLTRDPNYKTWATQARAGGQTVLGYIPTGYGLRSLSWVQAQAKKYRRWYGVTAFFLDEVSTLPDGTDYYRQLTTALQNEFGNNLIVLNPGSVPDQSYFDLGANTRVVIFEGPASNFDPEQFPSWLSQYYPQSVILLYSSKLTRFSSVLQFAESNGIAGIYATDAGLSGNPYDTLPSYWTTEYLSISCN